MSGLSFVHPHLGTYCAERGIRRVAINLLEPELSETATDWPIPLQRASSALSQTFRELLGKENIDLDYVQSANISFDFYRGRWPSACLVRLHLADGKHVEMAVDWHGRRAEVAPSA